MYLKPQIHGTQDTLTIHVGYKGIHSRIRISSPTCGGAWIPPNPRDTCPACIPHVFRMYPACILITSEDTCISHVSRMSQFISDTSLSGCIWDTCILDVSRMYLDHPCRYIYLACIPNVSCISDTYLVMTRPRYMYRDFVSRCILMYHKMYRDEESKIHVSWCILICIQCDTKEASKIHVSWCIWYVSQNVSWTRLGYV